MTAISRSAAKLDRTYFHRYSDTGVHIAKDKPTEGGTAMNIQESVRASLA